MKSILLLAAIYSLIIHQWHKEKGTVLASMQPVQAAATVKPAKYGPAVSFTANSQLFVLNTLTKLSK